MFLFSWFVSPQFLFYDLMREVIRGTYTSLTFSMLFALVVLLLTSGNVLITLYAMLTITFIIADTVAVFVLCGWELNILETIIIIMSVGLSVDFSKKERKTYFLISLFFHLAVHYGVAYIKADWKKNQSHVKRSSHTLKLIENNHKNNGKVAHEKQTFFQRLKRKHQQGSVQRFRRMKNSLTRVGSAVFIAGFTSFLAGVSMAPSKLTSFSQMGFFLMLIMFISWLFATWFFLPLLSFIGPTDQFGDIP
jgi:predicted RND superfamily exporter protein